MESKWRKKVEFRKRSNFQVAVLIWGGVMGMLGLAYASVPLYRLFCQTTGFAGTPKVATSSSETLGKKHISVRFDANVGLGLPWSFKPETPQIHLQVGETSTVFFTVTNLSDKDTIGISSYNVAPEIFGSYFNKLTCFCFTEQHLKPKETMTMAVVFYLDPALEQDETAQNIENITLSYTFFVAKSADQAQL